MNNLLEEKNQIPQILVNAFGEENIEVTIEEAKIAISGPLPQAIKQILKGKIRENRRTGIYEYELIIKIHDHFLKALVNYFDFERNGGKKPVKLEARPPRKAFSNILRNDSEFEKHIANTTLKKLGWLK